MKRKRNKRSKKLEFVLSALSLIIFMYSLTHISVRIRGYKSQEISRHKVQFRIIISINQWL